MMKNNTMIWAEEISAQLIADRRRIHQNPELSFCENETMQFICQRLKALNIPFQSRIAGTGVLAQISGTAPGNGKEKCLLIRADMDALEIYEQRKSPYCSQNNGVMHACGHDAHTAILLGVCTLLQQHREMFSGTVKFAFQPGEETTGGAEPMIRAGVLKNPDVDACVALHVDSDLDSGTMRIKPGSLYASPDDFSITVYGRGGHGAEPQHAIDPIVIAAQIITQLQTIISRNIDPFEEAVLTIGSVHAGKASNVIPDKAELLGTARSLTNEMRHFLAQRIRDVVHSVCTCYGAKYEYRFIELFPPLINNPKIAQQLLESGKRCLGEDSCIWGGRPTMAGEDFAYFSQAVPSALFKLGCRNEQMGITAPIHNPMFDIDESCLVNGTAIFTDFALHFLSVEEM